MGTVQLLPGAGQALGPLMRNLARASSAPELDSWCTPSLRDGLLPVAGIGKVLATVVTSSPFVAAMGDRPDILVNPSQILLWACGAEGHFEFFSPSWIAFTGRDFASELGQGWLERVLEEDRPLLCSDLLDALHRKSAWRGKFRLLHRDGDYRWLSMEAMARYEADGHFAGFIGYCVDISQHEAAHAEPELSTSHITGLLKQTDLLALMIDSSGMIVFTNELISGLLGKSAERLLNTSFFDHFGSDRVRSETLFSSDGRASDFPAEFETPLVGSGQSLILWHSMAQKDYAGRLAYVVLVGEDVTAQRTEEAKLNLTSKVFESSNLAMAITDAKGSILSVNGAFTQLTGYSQEEARGQNPRILQSGRHGPEFYKAMWHSVATRDHWHGDIWDRRKDGTIYPKFLSINAIRDHEGRVTNYSSIFSDITERKAIEEKLSSLAHLDALTELPNRTLLRQRLSDAIATVAGSKDQVAVLYIDLDRFKQVNDTLGHQAGDQVLLEVTRRLKAGIRASDTVARVGGDEFIVLLPRVSEVEIVARVASKIVEALKRPIALEQGEALCTPSIGISLFPDHGQDIDALIHCADQAMYKIKTTTRCGFHFYGQAEEDA
ncbi:sensor domain-containing protein [Roseateles violae]|uniref:Diguanylate cyclase n=1 Tax=Roseateles violae TaxID=3058042 RepID=A0ABT8DUM7_9BURK|nr:diguanylate cyclase [Pelomonas sp. PFR6]MDN3920758.1 diguanylate cyclase [Pelomonas sp. PFR6]